VAAASTSVTSKSPSGLFVFPATRHHGVSVRSWFSTCIWRARLFAKPPTLTWLDQVRIIGLSIAPFSPLGLQGSLFHILNHAVMKGAAFIAVAGIVTALAVTHVDKLKGLARRMPITSLGLVISLLALAGVPPLSGFWSKLMLFGSAIDAGTVVWWGPWLAVAGVLNSALSLAYYGWIIRKMYFEGEREKRIKEPRSIIAIMIFSIIFMVTIGVYPEPIIQFTEFATPAIDVVFTP